MIYDFHARHSLVLKPGVTQQEGIDFLAGGVLQPPKKWEDLSDVEDLSARLHLLAQAVVLLPDKDYPPYKDYARVGRRGKPAGLLHAVASGKLREYFELQNRIFLTPLKLYPNPPDLTLLPSGTWSINFNFSLHKPYISRDDTDFYIIDNPVKKEWVFKLPYIAPSQWKGALRAAMVKQLADASGSLSEEEFADRRFCLSLLFGDEKGEEQGDIKGLAEYLDKAKPDAYNLYRQKIHKYFSIKDDEPLPHHAGRLIFYPTYFTQIGLEVINPHDRETGTGAQPIYFESVPSGAEGTFVILYLPFDMTGEEQDKIKKASFADISLVAEGVRAMMLQHGFGAKTSCGHGIANNELIEGKFILKSKGLEIGKKEETTVKSPEQSFLKYLNDDHTVKKEYLGGGKGGLLSSKEIGELKQKLSSFNSSEFQRFRDWFIEDSEKWKKHIQTKGVPTPDFKTWNFRNFDDMTGQSVQIARLMKINEGQQ